MSNISLRVTGSPLSLLFIPIRTLLDICPIFLTGEREVLDGLRIQTLFRQKFSGLSERKKAAGKEIRWLLTERGAKFHFAASRNEVRISRGAFKAAGEKNPHAPRLFSL